MFSNLKNETVRRSPRLAAQRRLTLAASPSRHCPRNPRHPRPRASASPAVNADSYETSDCSPPLRRTRGSRRRFPKQQGRTKKGDSNPQSDETDRPSDNFKRSNVNGSNASASRSMPPSRADEPHQEVQMHTVTEHENQQQLANCNDSSSDSLVLQSATSHHDSSRERTYPHMSPDSTNHSSHLTSSGVGSGRCQSCRQDRRLIRTYRGLRGLGAVPVKGESYCDCPRKGRDVDCMCGEEDSVFDWTWDGETKSTATEISKNRRQARFHVNYSSGTAAVRGNEAMKDRQYFWEIKMTTPVYGTDMMVGVGTESVDLDAFKQLFTSILGRDDESWGISYYGRLQHKAQFKRVSGARFGQGSIIGVHLNMWDGTVSFYKNRKSLGVAYAGLGGKTLFPMVSSTAARTGMKIIKACSFETSLQFLCCQVLRRIVPAHLDVLEAVNFPPGLRAFLTNNLSWLLRTSELSNPVQRTHVRCSKKRPAEEEITETEEESEENMAKRARLDHEFTESDYGSDDDFTD